MKKIILGMLFFSSFAFATIEEDIVALKARVEKLELQVAKNCHLIPVFWGRTTGWCPEGTFISDIRITPNIVWTGCSYYRLDCPQ